MDIMRRMRRSESGFGLAELLVAMTIVAIILMALAPFLISAFKTTARNVRTAGATELVNRRIDLVQSRAVTSSCDAFSSFLTAHASATHVDNVVADTKRNITYQVWQGYDAGQVAGCKTGTPRTYYYTVTVVDQGTGKELATAATWVAVPGFGS